MKFNGDCFDIKKTKQKTKTKKKKIKVRMLTISAVRLHQLNTSISKFFLFTSIEDMIFHKYNIVCAGLYLHICF